MADVPEEYGGLDLGFAMSMLIAEKTAANSDFSVSFAAHVGIEPYRSSFTWSDEQRQHTFRIAPPENEPAPTR